MEKESVKKFDLEAAFKALDEIEIPQTKGIRANRVDLKERFGHKPATETLVEDYYDVSSTEDLEDAKKERDGEIAKAKLARIEKIVDLNAETPEDLLPSYVGKVIMQCPQCMTLFYKNQEDIEPSDENPDIVNLNEPCQHCGNTSGYTLIGKVGAVSEDEVDKYDETSAEENELDLDFDKGTEEVDAEGTGEGAEEMSDEEQEEESSESEEDLDLKLEEVPEEEPEEKKKEESLKESKTTKQRLTVVEPGYQYKDEDGNLYTLYGDELEEDDTGIVYDWEFVDDENGDIYIKEEIAEESLNLSKEASENESEHKSENLTLNEEIDKDLDEKLKAHNDYIAYLQQMIKQEEEALKKAENDEIKAAIQRRLDAFTADLEAALPDAVKAEAPVEETEETIESATDEDKTEEKLENLTLTESAESEIDSIIASWDANESLKESLNEDLEDLKANATIVDYVEYKHSYCHALEPKLKKINYYANVLKKPVNYIKAMVKDIIKNSPEVRWTDKEQWFMDKLNEFWPDSYELYKFIKNSIEKAHDTWVYVNAEGELIPELNKDMISLPVKESLTEEGDLDRLLDSDEFKTPVSEEEIDAARKEVAEESLEEKCGKQKITEESDSEIAAIIDSWEDTPEARVEESCEGPECESKEECDDCLKEEKEDESEVEENDDDSEEVCFTAEEVKEVATDVAQSLATPVEDEEEAEKQAEEIADVVDEKVDGAIEEKVEETDKDEDEESAEEDESDDDDDDKDEIEEPKFSEDDIDELDEDSLNKHIDEYLKEVYSNVKSYETTDCTLKEGKLIVEGKISFNSGKEKLTMFEFLPAYCEGKLFFEGYNKDFSEDKAFKLNCSINESKTLITESFGYKYKINENLVEGLK